MSIDHFFQHAARRVNARFQPSTIERHEARWMEAAYKRRGAAASPDKFSVQAGRASKRFYVYFRGTRNGQHIEAATLPSAKALFANQHGLTSLSYIAGRKA